MRMAVWFCSVGARSIVSQLYVTNKIRRHVADRNMTIGVGQAASHSTISNKQDNSYTIK